MAGVDPDQFTLRSILLMANARMRHDWNQTADTLAMTANMNRRKDSRAFTRADFHPMIKTRPRRPGVQMTPEHLRSQRKMFSRV